MKITKEKMGQMLRVAAQMGNKAAPIAVPEACRALYTPDREEGAVARVSLVPVDKQAQFSWVGGSFIEDLFLAVPNGSGCFLIEEHGRVGHIGALPKRPFQWTGGGLYKGRFYCFPRSANNLLYWNVKERAVRQVDIGLTYKAEHHYGGVITPQGYLYQPPRNCDHILKVDLNTCKVKKIPLCRWMKLKSYRYCGSVLHPNGLIYFLPETGQKVICLDPETDKVHYLGGIVGGMVFDAKVMEDGCIYGFSAYGKGILKVDPSHAEAAMIHTDRSFGCYGTKRGPNGKLYGIPGDGDDIWEYDVKNDRLISIYKMPEAGIKAKCAGGATNVNGDIYGVPAAGHYLLQIRFDLPEDFAIEEPLYDMFFRDFY